MCVCVGKYIKQFGQANWNSTIKIPIYFEEIRWSQLVKDAVNCDLSHLLERHRSTLTSAIYSKKSPGSDPLQKNLDTLQPER